MPKMFDANRKILATKSNLIQAEMQKLEAPFLSSFF